MPFDKHVKQSPVLSLAGFGGGISRISIGGDSAVEEYWITTFGNDDSNTHARGITVDNSGNLTTVQL